MRLQTELTPALAAKLTPDVGVVAAGSEIDGVTLPGKDLPHVVIAHDIQESAPSGHRVVVIRGERIGLVVGEYLASRGKDVTIVEMGKRMDEVVIATFKWRHAA